MNELIPEAFSFMLTAVLVDGGFFLKRYHYLYPENDQKDAVSIAKFIVDQALRHVAEEGSNLYRIFYYDCPPFLKKVHTPVSKKCIDFQKTPQAAFREQLFEELKKKRKVALRLGYIQDGKQWTLHPNSVKELLARKKQIDQITDDDFSYELRQKGVDMRIGLDISSLSYKKLVQQIILIAGDCDFVPAAKLARREGIDFILDPMWNNLDPQLHEHIDGLKTFSRNPSKRPTSSTTP